MVCNQLVGSEASEMLKKLPKQLLNAVCDHLSYEDMLMLRCTCKSLKKFVDSKKFTTLHLFVRKFPFHRRLFYTGETIGYSHSFHSNDLTILRSRRLKKQFANVQKMTIYHRKSFADYPSSLYPTNELRLDDLNFFRELIHLEVFNEAWGYEQSGKLNLPKLRISAFETNSSEWRPFELDCPRLRALKIKHNSCSSPCKYEFYNFNYGIRWITLTSADQLDYFHYAVNSTSQETLIRILRKVRKLSTIVFERGDFLLNFLPYLKKTDLSTLSQIRLENCVDLEALDELASGLEDLKRDPRTEHIRFTLMGRPIHSPNELRRMVELKRVYEVDNCESYKVSLSKMFKGLKVNMNELSEEQLKWYMRGNDLYAEVLKDRSLLFLNGQPELQFLLTSAHSVILSEEIDLSKEIIKKLKNVTRLEFYGLFRASDLTTELVIKNCKSLRSWRMYHQTVTERLLEIMSEQLVGLECLSMRSCRHETLKPLAKFRNLEFLSVDFSLERDDLTSLFGNSRTLEMIRLEYHTEKRSIELLRTTRTPTIHSLTILKQPKPYTNLEFDTLNDMIEHYVNRLFGNPEVSTSQEPLR